MITYLKGVGMSYFTAFIFWVYWPYFVKKSSESNDGTFNESPFLLVFTMVICVSGYILYRILKKNSIKNLYCILLFLWLGLIMGLLVEWMFDFDFFPIFIIPTTVGSLAFYQSTFIKNKVLTIIICFLPITAFIPDYFYTLFYFF